MKLERFKIVDFENYNYQPSTILVPTNAEFTDRLTVLHDGIYAWFKTSLILVELRNSNKFTFQVIKTGEDIPDGARLIDILSIVTEVNDDTEASKGEPSQGMMLFPVFMLA